MAREMIYESSRTSWRAATVAAAEQRRRAQHGAAATARKGTVCAAARSKGTVCALSTVWSVLQRAGGPQLVAQAAGAGNTEMPSTEEAAIAREVERSMKKGTALRYGQL